MLNSQRLVFIFLVVILAAGSQAVGQFVELPLVTQPAVMIQDAEVQDEEKQDDSKDKDESRDGKAEGKSSGDNRDDNNADQKSNSEEDRSKKTRRRRIKIERFTKQAEELSKIFSPVVASAAGAVVKITDGKRQIAFGTVVDSDGLILTKASELRGDLKCKLVDGKELSARVMGIDEETDLALLRVEADELAAAPWSEKASPQVGAWLANVNQTSLPLSIGIVSHNVRKIANSKAMIGIYLEGRESGGVRITRVSAKSPADVAGLLINDVVMGVDGVDTLTHPELRDKLADYEPGDQIKLKIERSGKTIEVELTLSSEAKISPMSARGSSQNRMGSSLSRRRRNFPLALQHDSALNADQCGGPIVDLSGRVVGINIARDGRVSSLALPIEVVLPAVERLKSGKLAPEVVNKESIAAIDQQLAELMESIGDLPERRNKAEINRGAALAQQDELERMKKEIEERLKKVQAENKPLIEKAKKLSNELDALEKRRQRLEADRKRMASGVR